MQTASSPPASGATDETDAMALRLAGIVRGIAPGATGIRIAGLHRSSGGFSRENWVFDAAWQEGGGERTLSLLLRTDPEASPQATERDLEYRVLKALETSDVPSPRVFWLDNAGATFGRPALVMERMPGLCDWTVLNGDQPPEVRLSLARSFLTALATLHSFDWRAAGLGDVLGEPGGNVALAELDHGQARLAGAAVEPLPEMDLIADWLRRNAPEPSALVLVHGDYKPGNALYKGERFSAILDWETAHLGDPLEDLGWMLMPSRRREQQIRGVWEQAQILGEYRRLTGRSFDPAALRWWIVFSTWKLAINNFATASAFARGQSDRIGHMPSWLLRPMFKLMAEAR